MTAQGATKDKGNMIQEFSGIAIVTGHTCGDACWHAKEVICRCSCGGKNHGIFKRGGEQPGRTAKIGGQVYRLLEVGTQGQIESRRMEEIRRINWHWFYDPKGPYLAKPATASQLKNWPEVATMAGNGEEIGGRPNVYLLWERTDQTDESIPLRPVRVIYEDGESYETQINGTRSEIRAYFIGAQFEQADETTKTVARVEFLPIETE